VVTVDYSLKGTTKTHYIVVKATISKEGKPQFTCQHPSLGSSN